MAGENGGPDLSLEAECAGVVCGVDEAGRGPWAGPVLAAAVILDPARVPAGIDDSKKLTAAKREALYLALSACARIGVGAASVREIDALNILQATLLAMRRAVLALPVRPDHALIDGNRAPGLECRVTTVVQGDTRSLSIAAASIVAKVTRDRLMRRLALRYPAYGWESNMGYGAPAHQAGLAQAGVTPHHRLSFAPIHRVRTQDVAVSV